MRLLLLILTLICLTQFTLCQTHYIYGGFGYNFPTATSLIGSEYSNNGYDLKKGTYGDGYNLQIGYSIFLFENIGLDIFYDNLIGFRYKQYFDNGNEHDQYDNRASSITTSIIMKQDVGKFSPFIKFGASLNFITIKIGVPDFYHIYENDYSIGWSSTLGLDYRITPSVSLFIDSRLNIVTFYPNKISFYQDGKLITVSYPKPRLPVNGGISAMELVNAYPFSSLGLSFGIKIKL